MGIKTSKVSIVLASASPRRKDLLLGLGLHFRIVPSTVDEVYLDCETPEDHVSRLALAKALDVAERFPDAWVLGADTVVVIDQRILGKPKSRREARTRLATLTGRSHEVFTGYALVHSRFTERQRLRYVRSIVHIRELTPKEIAAYVRTGESMDKAGAYAIQGIGSGIVERIEGSYTNVVGLPLCEVARDLKEMDVFDFLKLNGKP
jgi:septum formation protein